jgi:adenylate kinase family enzyme
MARFKQEKIRLQKDEEEEEVIKSERETLEELKEAIVELYLAIKIRSSEEVREITNKSCMYSWIW